MHPSEQDIIAALLKRTWEHGLISEATYRAALNKLFCTAGTYEISRRPQQTETEARL